MSLLILITIFFSFHIKNLHFNNALTKFVSKDDPAVKLMFETGEKFGSNNLVMVVLKPVDRDIFSALFLKKIKTLTEKLQQNENVFLVSSLADAPFITKIEGGIDIRNFLWEIPKDKEGLNQLKKEALSKENYINNYISREGEWAALAVYLKEKGDNVKKFKEEIKPVIEDHFKNKVDIYFSGIPSDAYYADKFISTDILKLVPAVLSLMIIILSLSFRKFYGVLFPLMVVILATSWVFGLMGLFDIPMNLITPGMPVLLIALGSAYGIHIMNQIFTDKKDSKTDFSNLTKSMSHIALPVILAGVTTAAGFISFITAKLRIIRDFGILSATGIVFAVLISLTFIPACKAILSKKKETVPKKQKEKTFLFVRFLPDFVIKHPITILIASFVLFIIFFSGVFKIQREVNLSEYYPIDSKPTKARNIVKEHFGGSYILTLYFKGENIKSASRLRLIRRTENYLYSIESINVPFSISDTVQNLNFELNGFYSIPDSDGRVNNLWFFLEGRKELKQLVTEDMNESLVVSKTPVTKTEYMKKIQKDIESFLSKEFSQDIFAYSLEDLSAQKALLIRRKETYQVLEEISWLSFYYGGKGINVETSGKKLESLINFMPQPEDDDVLEIIQSKFKSYIYSDYFDFIISDKTKKQLFERLITEVARGKDSQDNFEQILSKTIPSKEYDSEIASYVASTLIQRIEEASRISFTERAWNHIFSLLPEDSTNNKNFCKKARGLLHEISDNLAVLPQLKSQRIPGNKVTFDRIDQSGFPAFLNSLDHSLYVSQYQSLFFAFLLTFLIVSLMKKSIRMGIVAIIPIGFCLAVIYGFLGLTGIPLDYATMMIAGVSIGVGIDYTIHFIHAVGKGMEKGLLLKEAVYSAFTEKWKPILTNSTAVLMGFLVLLLSSLSPLRDFGCLMAGSMFLAALSALTLLPSLILVIKPKFGGKK